MKITEIEHDSPEALKMEEYGLPSESHCLKQRMAAVIVDEDDEWVGIGWNGPAENSAPRNGDCPRIGMSSGERYELCDDACPAHVHDVIGALQDYESIKEYVGESPGLKLYLIGHGGNICPHCLEAAEKAGIEDTYVIKGNK